MKKDQELLGFEGPEALDKTEEVSDEAKWWVMQRLHASIKQREPEETAYSYLGKVIAPIYYHRTAEVFHFYETHPDLMAQITQQCHFAPILEIFLKLLEAESASKFFVDFKKKYLGMIYEAAREGLKREEAGVGWAVGLFPLHRFVNDRLEEQGENVGRYSALMRGTEAARMDIQQDMLGAMEGMPEELVLWSLRWV